MNEKKPRRRQLSFVDVREIALSMPEVEETTAYGMPAFKAGKTRFAGQPYPRPDVQPNSIGVPISFEERARLLALRPDVYYLTDHFRNIQACLCGSRTLGATSCARSLARRGTTRWSTMRAQ